ncbi:hypothetical protein [Pseudomonas fontis]|uniref:Secreted protein n=1 Tax=Pseudomonas fontis TaxID=2942633 RepID=A0ABT5NP21_9PSED|nr:hypothetical protein [Pseudomonas fontis]MDD0974368.1 hypothetical protein [Pseudomonas fontis]MDD0989910.1 hypothetical protein [Pseudomonas fontis]
MKLFKFALIAALALGSTTAFAEGGAERSKAFWEQFRLSQEQVHGSKTDNVVKDQRPEQERVVQE